jgi:hypothetical protein
MAGKEIQSKGHEQIKMGGKGIQWDFHNIILFGKKIPVRLFSVVCEP